MSLMMNYSLFIICCLASIYSSNGNCVMEDVDVWQRPYFIEIKDYHDGVIFQKEITNIQGFSVVKDPQLNGGPYMTSQIEGSSFTIRTNENFRQYEENEIAQIVTSTFTFQCTDGSEITGFQVRITINDTNNNDPIFKTEITAVSADTTYEYTIFLPVGPGVVINNCVDDIIVRDVDLTTYRIDFEIEENDFFELAYDEAALTTDKEFRAILRTTSLIRSLPEPVVLRIFATDVDLTGDQPITRNTTVTILGSPGFTLPDEPVFNRAFYKANYDENNQVSLEQPISLQQGYDDQVEFILEGDYANNFKISNDNQELSFTVESPLPTEVLRQKQIFLVVKAIRADTSGASATIFVQLPEESRPGTETAFDKFLYEGTIRLNEVHHEHITISGYTGDTVDILGVYRDLFSASITEGVVVVATSDTLGLPEDVTFVPLELRAGGASAVLLLNVLQSETPELPSISFGSPSYVLRAEITQTGLVGLVSATTSSGESVVYSLDVGDAHLQERVSVNSAGEIRLSAPTNTGVYSFLVIATSVIAKVQAQATVQLTIEATAICGDDDHVLPPLIILERNEEEPHQNLVVIDSATQAGCELRLTNRWPLEQDWLYVDGNGLHARSIDREDPRIAFMALSQVQVELVLECADDTQTRVRRSANTNSRLDWLGPYEYGSNNWILTDTILYNSRRSFVNLIVNDINDNYPIFVGKSNEPIVVGYPKPELEDLVLPRALAELKATDADVGENAALMYWSPEEVLAVAPRTGSVHVRDGVTLVDDMLLTVSVTDCNGHEEGLTRSIQLLVKLIDVHHIAVVTVRNAFSDQEEAILSKLTAAVGYEVKVLSSRVISDDTNANLANSRHKREVTNAEGSSLQLYVYGVIDREPVAVKQLSTDITENVLAGVDVTSTVSLEDHLEGRLTPGGRDTGLLVSTIVLSVLLFILIVAIAVWCFLRWRTARNYEQFSDTGSLASRSEPLEPPPKEDTLKKPRMDLEELKRSERRLQEMLEAPIDGVAAKPSTSAVGQEGIFDMIINMAPPETAVPIVIQSIDRLKDDENSGDEDEFGERKSKNRRKSVVTFNKNVEKIIHVENIPDDNSSDIEVFKF